MRFCDPERRCKGPRTAARDIVGTEAQSVAHITRFLVGVSVDFRRGSCSAGTLIAYCLA
jgi:hypothetical protein